MSGIWLIAALALIISVVIVSRRRRLERLKRYLAANWGKRTEDIDADAIEAISLYWRELSKAQNRDIDDITWNDLDMEQVFKKLDYAECCVGEEILYAMLRDTGVSNETLAKRRELIRSIEENPAERVDIRLALRRIGKERYHGANAYLFNPSSKHPQNAWAYLTLALIPIAFLIAGMFYAPCYLGILLSFAVNAFVYYKSEKTWAIEIFAVRHIAAVLNAANSIANALPKDMAEQADVLRGVCAEMKPVKRWNALFAMQRQGNMDFLTDYVRILFLLDMNCLTRLSVFFEQHNATLRKLYSLVGEIDACVSVAAYRASGAYWAEPEFIDELRVEAVSLAHPLIDKPVRNDIVWSDCALITGSNASGKSTFVKALAVNAILAQSVLTCDAERFIMPRAHVMTSMALRDNLLSAESYFIVEIKSLRRILSALTPDHPTLCFIDEILRGTNTVERIAASSALLSYMLTQNCLCMAATHDRELTEMLPKYRKLHFREHITPEGMEFPYKLLEGASDTRNAISLLRIMEFPESVVDAAESAAASFDETRKWTNA